MISVKQPQNSLVLLLVPNSCYRRWSNRQRCQEKLACLGQVIYAFYTLSWIIICRIHCLPIPEHLAICFVLCVRQWWSIDIVDNWFRWEENAITGRTHLNPKHMMWTLKEDFQRWVFSCARKLAGAVTLCKKWNRELQVDKSLNHARAQYYQYIWCLLFWLFILPNFPQRWLVNAVGFSIHLCSTKRQIHCYVLVLCVTHTHVTVYEVSASCCSDDNHVTRSLCLRQSFIFPRLHQWQWAPNGSPWSFSSDKFLMEFFSFFFMTGN